MPPTTRHSTKTSPGPALLKDNSSRRPAKRTKQNKQRGKVASADLTLETLGDDVGIDSRLPTDVGPAVRSVTRTADGGSTVENGDAIDKRPRPKPRKHARPTKSNPLNSSTAPISEPDVNNVQVQSGKDKSVPQKAGEWMVTLQLLPESIAPD